MPEHEGGAAGREHGTAADRPDKPDAPDKPDRPDRPDRGGRDPAATDGISLVKDLLTPTAETHNDQQELNARDSIIEKQKLEVENRLLKEENQRLREEQKQREKEDFDKPPPPII